MQEPPNLVDVCAGVRLCRPWEDVDEATASGGTTTLIPPFEEYVQLLTLVGHFQCFGQEARRF
jgi:hypothetical protein